MNDHQELISTLAHCLSACENCASACLDEDNVKKMVSCIRINRDCADICGLSIKFLSRKSKNSNLVIGICADICSECAEECDKYEHDHCKKCAEACRKCADSCKDYLNA
ncbi:MAG TPA: four-helix bundle copper-binding protein [Balneolaceae bacterium]